jgi:hypothetical protein
MIFVLPPSMTELKKRLIERGREGEERIKSRMEAAIDEMELAARYNYVVVNDNLDECVDEVRKIIRICRVAGVEFGGTVCCRTPEEVIDIILICKNENVKIAQTMFLRKPDEARKIIIE